MTDFPSERGVSTVIDVALALLLISASVMIVGYYLATTADESPVDSHGHETTGAGQTHGGESLSAAQMTDVLSESTISVTYSIEDIRDEDEFSEPVITNDNTYSRTDHGSPLGLLADAAVMNYQIDGKSVVAYSDAYEEAVDWSIRENLVGTEQDFYVVAEWEPYADATINGTATAGTRPPANADVSSTSTTVSSGVSPIDDSHFQDYQIDDNESSAVAATVIGKEIVDGFFPPESSQYALEDQGINREQTVYQYQSMAEAVGEFSFRSPDTHPPLTRTEANAQAANRNLLVGQEGGYDVTDADALAAWLASDLEDAFESEFEEIDDNNDETDRDEKQLEAILDETSTDTVTITIQTWNE
ncbi:DUF7284 family protein [Natronorubrum daqingense]|uniref:Uncharacterized protein n=1 Tax=Natronorubrum daqingense TaxID=588898 RepID=A0A1N7ECY5_9EURY|nr:hypothetical protein [Natronorubrum daqingense]SIR85879.1 hypothetical protein SAMN05421809_2614 [Natronorubrum daqingense]